MKIFLIQILNAILILIYFYNNNKIFIKKINILLFIVYYLLFIVYYLFTRC